MGRLGPDTFQTGQTLTTCVGLDRIWPYAFEFVPSLDMPQPGPARPDQGYEHPPVDTLGHPTRLVCHPYSKCLVCFKYYHCKL